MYSLFYEREQLFCGFYGIGAVKTSFTVDNVNTWPLFLLLFFPDCLNKIFHGRAIFGRFCDNVYLFAVRIDIIPKIEKIIIFCIRNMIANKLQARAFYSLYSAHLLIYIQNRPRTNSK